MLIKSNYNNCLSGLGLLGIFRYFFKAYFRWFWDCFDYVLVFWFETLYQNDIYFLLIHLNVFFLLYHFIYGERQIQFFCIFKLQFLKNALEKFIFCDLV
jgi:hypothetical protein